MVVVVGGGGDVVVFHCWWWWLSLSLFMLRCYSYIVVVAVLADCGCYVVVV